MANRPVGSLCRQRVKDAFARFGVKHDSDPGIQLARRAAMPLPANARNDVVMEIPYAAGPATAVLLVRLPRGRSTSL